MSWFLKRFPAIASIAGGLTILVGVSLAQLGPTPIISGGGTSTTVVSPVTISNIINDVTFNTYLTTNVFNTFNATTVQSTTVNVSGKGQFNQVIITNGFFAKTNLWSGPTNDIDVSIYNQGYSSLVPVKFTGIANKSNAFGGEVKLVINNISSSNITALYGNAGFADSAALATSETITNGHRGIFWINYDPALSGQTNVVFQHF